MRDNPNVYSILWNDTETKSIETRYYNCHARKQRLTPFVRMEFNYEEAILKFITTLNMALVIDISFVLYISLQGSGLFIGFCAVAKK